MQCLRLLGSIRYLTLLYTHTQSRQVIKFSTLISYFTNLADTPVYIQGILENEYIGSSFAVGQIRSITGLEAMRSAFDISANSNSKWDNLLVLFLMAVGYRFLVFIFLHFRGKQSLFTCIPSNSGHSHRHTTGSSR